MGRFRTLESRRFIEVGGGRMSREEIIQLVNVLILNLHNCEDSFVDEVLYSINNAELMDEF